jgi:hypothetical protein
MAAKHDHSFERTALRWQAWFEQEVSALTLARPSPSGGQVRIS